LAGILAAFFPFGVGAVYCAQYAKGLAHLIIFVLLIVGASHSSSDAMGTIFGLSIAAFYFYQLIDAIKSAKALQLGQPPPDPFGLGSMFTTGERHELPAGVPTGAVILIVLGVLFLLHNLGPWYLAFDTIWPILLIALGAWLFAKRRVAPEERHRSLTGPAVLVTVGALWLINNLHGPSGMSTWPIVLLILGVIQLVERGYLGGQPLAPPPPPPPSPPASPSEPEPPPEVNTEVNHG
jgi:TM2 domain-containing membrane protein YozV